jgi:hypothetical protein
MLRENMNKKELIQQIIILDNVGETENTDLSKLKKKELENLYEKIFEYSHSRQNAWIKAYSDKLNK